MEADVAAHFQIKINFIARGTAARGPAALRRPAMQRVATVLAFTKSLATASEQSSDVTLP